MVAARRINPPPVSDNHGINKAVEFNSAASFFFMSDGALLVKIFDENPQARIVFTFGFAAAALMLLIFASMVEMPLQAIFIALAISDIIFLGIVLLGHKIPGARK